MFRVLSIGSGALLITALLSGCVALEDRSTDTSSKPASTITSTVTATPTPEPETVASSTAASTTPVQCNVDPRTSDFGQFLAQSRTPVGELGATPDSVLQIPDMFYHFQMGENGYDSCAELSYVVLNGSNGGTLGPAGTGSAISDALVLFHNGQLVTHPAPFEMKEVESVTRISDSELQVIYGHAGGATAEGVTEKYTFTFFIDNGVLSGRGDLPKGIDGHLRLSLA